jgi:hypothetical protein
MLALERLLDVAQLLVLRDDFAREARDLRHQNGSACCALRRATPTILHKITPARDSRLSAAPESSKVRARYPSRRYRCASPPIGLTAQPQAPRTLHYFRLV